MFAAQVVVGGEPTDWPRPRHGDRRHIKMLGEVMSHLELSARMKIRPGQLEGFKTQAAEIMRLVREKDTHTLRYDWFVNQDGTECEVRETYESEQGMFEHNQHVLEARNALFRDFAYDHRMTVYGEVSQQLVDLANAHAGGLGRFSFLQGFQMEPMT